MTDIDHYEFYEASYEAAHTDCPEDAPTVVVVTEPSVVQGLTEGLAIHGYNTRGYSSEPASREYLAALALHIVDSKPDAVVTLVAPERRDILFYTFKDVLPLVMLHTVNHPYTGSTAKVRHHRAPILPSELAAVVASAIAQPERP